MEANLVSGSMGAIDSGAHSADHAFPVLFAGEVKGGGGVGGGLGGRLTGRDGPWCLARGEVIRLVTRVLPFCLLGGVGGCGWGAVWVIFPVSGFCQALRICGRAPCPRVAMREVMVASCNGV